MKSRLKFTMQISVFGLLLMGAGVLAGAQDSSQQPAPDNTKVNQPGNSSALPRISRKITALTGTSPSRYANRS